MPSNAVTPRKRFYNTARRIQARNYRRRRMYTLYQRPSPFSFTPSLNSGVPTGTRITLKYADRYTLDSAVVNFGRWEWRGTSLFDPDLTATGHQPKGFDQMAALYRRYFVIGSKIKIMIGNKFDGLTQEAPIKAVLACKNVNTSMSMNELIEQPISTWGIQGTSATRPLILTLPYVSNFKQTGWKGVERDSIWSALVTDNPASNFYYEAFVERGGEGDILCQLHVEIVFDCWFYEPQDLLSS